VKRNEERCMRENTKISKKHKRKKMTLVSRQNERTLKREKERKKEKESANATTRIILLSIARYHNHLLCASVIFHYSN